MATATVEQLPGGRVRINGAVITQKASDGTLVCGNHPGQQFCEHVQACITAHADASMIGPADAQKTGIKIRIPLIPKMDQWGWVKFGEFHEATQAYKVYLEINKDQYFLGFQQMGEGRFVLRSMIHDWFRGHVDPDTLRCTATSHKFQQENEWVKNTGKGAAADLQWAEHWSVYTQKMCVACFLRVLSIDDLIPDSGGKKNWS